ncbi:hypothetical protein A0H81_08796 [Grifola frondosa]|uniref:Uncharacterized protein n=1 Tax=Grifola frondosa TaxID=5627 RepID=A0A1C7M9P7_GRIFR|nr:hypothetical protein A0H81_08796 [Grifola frondosa]
MLPSRRRMVYEMQDLDVLENKMTEQIYNEKMCIGTGAPINEPQVVWCDWQMRDLQPTHRIICMNPGVASLACSPFSVQGCKNYYMQAPFGPSHKTRSNYWLIAYNRDSCRAK